MESRTSLKMRQIVRSKPKSPGEMLEKPCVRSGGHIISQIIMKLGQNFCLDEISYIYENGSCRVTRSNLRKPCICSRD